MLRIQGSQNCEVEGDHPHRKGFSEGVALPPLRYEFKVPKTARWRETNHTGKDSLKGSRSRPYVVNSRFPKTAMWRETIPAGKESLKRSHSHPYVVNASFS